MCLMAHVLRVARRVIHGPVNGAHFLAPRFLARRVGIVPVVHIVTSCVPRQDSLTPPRPGLQGGSEQRWLEEASAGKTGDYG